MAAPPEHQDAGAEAQALGPVPTPLPDAPSRAILDHVQWEVLFALIDGVLPSIAAASAVSDASGQTELPDDELDRVLDELAAGAEPPRARDAAKAFLEFRPSQDPRFRDDCLRTLAQSSQLAQLGGVLSLLATRTGSLLFTGYWTPITGQPTRVREAIMRSWVASRFVTLRNLAKAIYTLAQKSNSITNPHLHAISGFPDVPHGWKPVDGYDFAFIQPGLGAEPHVIETDVVIVGSGYGGAVSAKNLAEAGHRVLVVDKGYHFPPSQLPLTQSASINYLFQSGGVLASEGSGAGILGGAVWGGGGTVNWSVCLKTQDYVRREWAQDAGLPVFATKQYDDCLDRVWRFVCAETSGIRHNHRNRTFLDGLAKLGWAGAPAAQNTGGREHYCGHCHLGCGSGEKNGPTASWLPAAGRAGARFMEGLRVDRVLFDDDGETAVGIEGLWVSKGPGGEVHTPRSERTERKVIIKAKKVIVSGGSLWSPLVLMKSGVENPHLGQNLHIHPCNLVTAVYKEETRPWEGGIITSYSTEFENLDEKGHGVKLEPTCMLPYTALTLQPWTSGLDSKLLQLKYRNLAGFISLTRDRDTGSVAPDRVSGEPRVHYDVSDYDREHTLEGVIALAKICYVTGATEIRPQLPGLEPFYPNAERQKQLTPPQQPADAGTDASAADPEFSDPAFARWLRRVREVGNKPPVAIWSSAHQMGTCRMGANPAAGVVDERGAVWGRRGLYVADASVFPSASGVNPMITVMAIADWISRGVVEDLARG